MKGGLCVIYTFLLTVSVVSSCALFLLVVSEALQADLDNTTVDLNDPHNTSDNLNAAIDHDVLETVSTAEEREREEQKDAERPVPEDKEMIFTETLSLNSVTTDGLPDTGQPPILISLVDSAKLEVKPPSELLFTNDSEQHNETKTFVVVEARADHDRPAAEHSTEATLVVQARSVQEARSTEETTPMPPTTATIAPEAEHVLESRVESDKQNESSSESVNPQEDIPSFSEWAQKQLAEAEKHTVLNHSSQPSHSSSNFSSKSAKLRSKNYASPACGAKIVAVNPEAGSAGSVLSPNRDEYMLNTCTSRIWFIVELCEAVQAQKIEMANFELFSSTPKDFAVYFSDRFPTRDWASVGQFTARDERDVQSFDLYPHLFGKFIKVEMLSHHGSEHYCPVSLFKVYGTSEFEVLEKESAQHASHAEDDDDEDEDDAVGPTELPAGDADTAKNLFGSARDAVMSIMKKAAQVLVKTEVARNVTSEHNDTTSDRLHKPCRSPSHIIVCDNCSEALYGEVFDLISCGADRLANALRSAFLRDTLKCTDLCRPFGLDFKSTKTVSFSNDRVAYLSALFSKKYIAALCNILAIDEKKVVMNTSFETEPDVTTNITVDESPKNTNSVSSTEPDVKLIPIRNTSTDDDTVVSVTKTHDDIPRAETRNDSDTKIDEHEIPKEDKEKINMTVKEDNTVTMPEDQPVQEQTELQADNKTDSELTDGTKQVESDKKGQEIKTDPVVHDSKNGKLETNTEKPLKDGAGVIGDDEQIFIESDVFIPEWDQLASDPTPTGSPLQSTQNSQQTIQKESVFLRLSNRVKTLERNMSLSGQYLEELSRRYKKQVEEMQKSFEKTVTQMSEERRKGSEREHRYLEQVSHLRQQIADLTAAVSILVDERDSWFGNITLFKFLVYQSIIISAVLYYIFQRRPDPIIVPVSKRNAKKKNQDKLKFRRKSVEGVSGHETPSAKKRRPSEEALQIERQSVEELDRDQLDGEWQVARRNRRRKTSIVHRNIENGRPGPPWERQDSIGVLHENPILLDDDEYIAPVSEPTEFGEAVAFRSSPREFPKTNGSLLNVKAKTKGRRLSSPAFLKTFGRQSTRSTPPGGVGGSPQPLPNGKLERKTTPESPTGSLWSASTDPSQPNGRCDAVTLGKPKKRSFKSIFKKVF